MPLYLSGTSGISTDNSTYSTALKFQTAQYFSSETRVALGTAPDANSRVIMWSVTFSRTNASAHIYMNGFLHGKQGYNGEAVYWWRINGGTWRRCGAHNYVGTYSCGEPLAGYLPASDYPTTGTPTIDIAFSSATGRPYNVWNPNSTDHTELTLPSGSHMNIYQILP